MYVKRSDDRDVNAIARYVYDEKVRGIHTFCRAVYGD